jgi:hypothetical protein
VGLPVPSLIVVAERGDRPAAEALFAALYSPLHRLAKRELARSGLEASLGATTLLHEVAWTWLGAAARRFPTRRDSWGMRSGDARTSHRPSRERHAQKYGGLLEITSLDTEAMENAVDHRGLVRISETFDELGKVGPALAEIIDL